MFVTVWNSANRRWRSVCLGAVALCLPLGVNWLSARADAGPVLVNTDSDIFQSIVGIDKTPASYATHGWTDPNCGGCHIVHTDASHPVGIRPSMTVPEGFPLDAGRMTCTTCHDDSSAEAHAQARMDGTSLLRSVMAGPAPCLSCHTADSTNRASVHGMVLHRAHLTPPNARRSRETKRSPVRPIIEKLMPEPTSVDCLGCHDGSIAAGGDHGRDWITGGTTGHPFGVSYPTSGGLPTQESRYVIPARLDLRIRLVRGRVECITCHNLYSQEPGLLVMPNAESALCVSCHQF